MLHGLQVSPFYPSPFWPTNLTAPLPCLPAYTVGLLDSPETLSPCTKPVSLPTNLALTLSHLRLIRSEPLYSRIRSVIYSRASLGANTTHEFYPRTGLLALTQRTNSIHELDRFAAGGARTVGYCAAETHAVSNRV